MSFKLLLAMILVALMSCLLFGIIDDCMAQCSDKEKISIKSGFFSSGFYCGSHKLTGSELEQILSKAPGALEEYNSGKSMYIAASIIQIIGGSLIGWPVGQAAAGEESPNWTMAIIGGGIAIPGLILEVVSRRHIRNAIDKYNSTIDKNDTKTSLLRRSFKVGLSNNGVFIEYSL